MDFKMPEELTDKEKVSIPPVFAKLRALHANGLTDVDLIRC